MIKHYGKKLDIKFMKWEPVYQAFLLVPQHQLDLVYPAKIAKVYMIYMKCINLDCFFSFNSLTIIPGIPGGPCWPARP